MSAFWALSNNININNKIEERSANFCKRTIKRIGNIIRTLTILNIAILVIKILIYKFSTKAFKQFVFIIRILMIKFLLVFCY